MTREALGDRLARHLSARWTHVDPGGALNALLVPSFRHRVCLARRPPARVDLLDFKHAFVPATTLPRNDTDDWNAPSSDWLSLFVELTGRVDAGPECPNGDDEFRDRIQEAAGNQPS